MPTNRLLRSAFVASVVVVTTLTGLAVLDASAGIVIDLRSSSLTVRGIGQDTPYEEITTFTESGTFDDSLSAQGGDVPDGSHSRGTATQNTTFNFGPGAGAPFSSSGRL